MTLKEYLEDYASPETKAKGEEIIAKRLEMIPNEKVREVVREHLGDIHEGRRDFRL